MADREQRDCRAEPASPALETSRGSKFSRARTTSSSNARTVR
jgi:hypothetical protein